MKKEIWLILSSFGIMFAIISWLQESQIIPSTIILGHVKGWIALFFGIILYLIFRKNV